MRYDRAILEALKATDRPLRHRDLVARIAPGEYQAYGSISASLTKLTRAGMVAREKPGQWFEYTYVDKPVIQRGYTWCDDGSPIVVMAVADGYAMCRRPGCAPFIRTVQEIEQERR